MTALRQEAMQMINDMPENLMAALVETIKNFKIQNETPVQDAPDSEFETRKAVAFARLEALRKENSDNLNSETRKPRKITEEEFQDFLHYGKGIDPKKAAALKWIEEWQERNKDILNSGIDWDKELEEALNEKYGIIG